MVEIIIKVGGEYQLVNIDKNEIKNITQEKYLKNQLSELQKQEIYKGHKLIKTKEGFSIQYRNSILKKEKQEKLKNLRNLFDEKLNNFLSNYPTGIRETFTLRSDEANKFIKTGKSDYLENLVRIKNIDRKKAGLEEIKVSDFADKILQKSSEFSQAYNKLESWYDLEKINILKNN